MAFAVVATVTAGCFGSARGHRLPGAAEPAAAASPAAVPAGHVIALPSGSDPEGVAVDAVDHLVAVALRHPDRVALVDTRTLRLRWISAVAASARHLSLADGGRSLLVPGEDTDQLVELDPRTGRVTTKVGVGRQPHDVTDANGDLWVTNEFGSSVAVIRDDGEVVTLPGPVQPGGVAATDGIVGAVDVRGSRLYLYDARVRRAAGSVRIGAGPSHVVTVGAGEFVVADTRASAVLLVGVACRCVQATLSLPGSVYGLAAEPTLGRVWVTLTGANTAVEVRVTGTHLLPLRRFATVWQPDSIAVDATSGCVYVAGRRSAQLQQFCG